jgi:hypothetical protein
MLSVTDMQQWIDILLWEGWQMVPSLCLVRSCVISSAVCIDDPSVTDSGQKSYSCWLAGRKHKRGHFVGTQWRALDFKDFGVRNAQTLQQSLLADYEAHWCPDRHRSSSNLRDALFASEMELPVRWAATHYGLRHITPHEIKCVGKLHLQRFKVD